MSRKRKSGDYYSDRHKRRLIKRETDLSVSRIKQRLPLSPQRENNLLEHSETIHSVSENSTVMNRPAFELVPPGLEPHNSDLGISHQNSGIHCFISSDDDTNIATQHLNIETNISTHHERIAQIVNITENQVSNHSDESNHSNCTENSQASSNGSHLLVSDICQWIATYKPPRGSVNAMLRILRKHTNTKLPKDYRALLKTPQSTEIHFIAGGQYWHNGLEKVVESIIKKRRKAGHHNKDIGLMVNIDGAPLGKSSQFSLWPILCSDNILKDVHVVGVFFGEGKPNNSNHFLSMFIEEAVTLLNNGLLIDNEQFDVRIQALICDAPAKSFILQVKNFNGYDSCSKCNIGGEFIERTMCFPSTGENITLRTDENFKNYLYRDDYQIGHTNLTRIPHLGLVTNVPLDYMHLICLGIVKKLLMLWIHGPLSVRLSIYDILKISHALVELRKYLPSDFVRKPRSLKFIKLWKATEYRQFLLYLGPIVLKNVLKDPLYKHFLVLHAAITILASPILAKHQSNVDYAEELLTYFVKSFEILYGVKYVSHNVHNLLHLANDVRKFGPLDEFSAFKFENYMSTIIKFIRKGERPLQQIARRLAEYDNISDTNIREEDAPTVMGLRGHHSEGPLTMDMKQCKQYRVMRHHSYYIDCNDSKNDCCMLQNGIMINCANFVKFKKTSDIIGYELAPSENIYSLPCESKIFNIQTVRRDVNLKSWPCANIHLKLMKIPLKPPDRDEIAVFPILHSSSNLH